MLRIENIRLGFANNSSSSHSMLMIPEGAKIPPDDDAGGFDFGWGYFVCASLQAKQEYLAASLYSAIGHQLGHRIARLIIKDLTGIEIPENGDEAWIGVDHQSALAFPRQWDKPTLVDEEFFAEFKAWYENDRIVVFGGNDNDEHEIPRGPGWKEVTPPFQDHRGESMVCRKDPKGFWTLFNRHSGAKIRLSFNEIPVTKSTFPELVDLKITDACPFGCAFCYQGSTPAGKETTYTEVIRVLYTLKDMRVFEVAIGGGEPTLWKGFFPLLAQIREQGIIPNFTTRNLAWLHDILKVTKMKEGGGTFAYSVQTADEVEKLFLAFQPVRTLFKVPPTVQVVLGVVSTWELQHIYEECLRFQFPLTILGYKTTGFGAQYTPKPYADWLKRLTTVNEHLQSVQIDTAVAQEFHALLEQEGVPRYTYHRTEGAHSMYIDAVQGKIGPSSYELERLEAVPRFEHRPHEFDWRGVPDVFAKYAGENP